MKKFTILSLTATVFGLAACGNDVDVHTDTAMVPVIDTAAGYVLPVPIDTTLRTDTVIIPDTSTVR